MNSKFEFDFPYKRLTEGENLYDDIELRETDVVDAEYRKVPGYEKNPAVCALPRPLTKQEILSSYKYVPDALLSVEKPERLSLEEKYTYINRIREIRHPLQFYKDIDLAVYNALLSSYSLRKYGINEGLFTGSMGNGSYSPTVLSEKESSFKSSDCVSLIGGPGIGKSTAMDMIVSRYPKAIHHTINGDSFLQIPIICVTASPNSNMNVLLEDAARQIDRICCLREVYESKMHRHSGPAKKASYLAELCEMFHIGIIIIDECQFLNYGSALDNTFEQLVTATAKTGVGIVLIGNNDATQKWEHVYRIARRFQMRTVSPSIIGNDRAWLTEYTKMLWSYQAVKKPELTERIIDTLLECSFCNIDLLSALFVKCQYEIINSRKNAGRMLDAEFIKEIYDRHFAGFTKHIKDGLLKNMEYLEDLKTILDEIKAEPASRREDNASMLEMLKNDEIMGYDHSRMLYSVTESITDCHEGITRKQIEKAFNRAEAKKPEFRTLSKQAIVKLVLADIMKKPAVPATAPGHDLPAGQKPELRTMIDELGLSGKEAVHK